MVIRMCPLCDHQMKKAHHCDVCGSFVWKPDYVDVHLSTTVEEDNTYNCAYPTDAKHTKHSYSNTEQAYRKQKKVKQSNNKAKTSKTSSKKNNKAGKIGVTLASVLVIIKVLGSLSNAGVFDDIEDWFQELIYSIEDRVKETVDEDYIDIEMTAEEVMDYGVQCNSYIHMPITGEEAFEFLTTAVQDMGYQTGEPYFSDYNSMSGSKSKDEKYLYFNQSRTCYSEDDTASVRVNSDTYSDKVHTLCADMGNVEDAEEILLKMLEYLESFEIDVSVSDISVIDDAFDFSDEDYNFIEAGDIEIYTSFIEYDGFTTYNIEITLLRYFG